MSDIMWHVPHLVALCCSTILNCFQLFYVCSWTGLDRYPNGNLFKLGMLFSTSRCLFCRSTVEVNIIKSIFQQYSSNNLFVLTLGGFTCEKYFAILQFELLSHSYRIPNEPINDAVKSNSQHIMFTSSKKESRKYPTFNRTA